MINSEVIMESRKLVLNARKALQYRLKATYKDDLRRAKKWERIWQKRIKRCRVFTIY